MSEALRTPLKDCTVDGTWSIIGSANIYSLSLFGLHEINLEVYSTRFASQMERMFELDKTNARELTLEAGRTGRRTTRRSSGASRRCAC